MGLRDLFELGGRVAIVTGGARGIGRACAEALAEMGASIGLVDLHEENLAKTAEALRAPGTRVATFCGDVRQPGVVAQGAEHLISSLGGADVLVNSAGLTIWAKAEELTEEQWDQVLDVDLKGTFLWCQAVGRHMIAQRKGSIINIASMSGSIVNKPQCQASYNAAKAGVIHLTRSLAIEWAPHNVRVNTISPGYTATEMTKTVPEYHAGWHAQIPMGRMAEPAELLGAVIYLASDASTYTTGHDLIIDGGYCCW